MRREKGTPAGPGRREAAGLVLAGIVLPSASPAARERAIDIGAALDAAAAARRCLIVAWERSGCQYCVELHANHLTQPAIRDFMRRHFAWLQLDTEGTRQAIDLDGEMMEERRLARRWQVAITPTLLFLPERRPAAGPGQRQAVARMNGLLPPAEFLGFLTYVADRAYESGESFPRWWRARNG